MKHMNIGVFNCFDNSDEGGLNIPILEAIGGQVWCQHPR